MNGGGWEQLTHSFSLHQVTPFATWTSDFNESKDHNSLCPLAYMTRVVTNIQLEKMHLLALKYDSNSCNILLG